MIQNHIVKKMIYALFSFICITLLSGCISGVYVDPAMSEKAKLLINKPEQKFSG